MDLTHSWRHAPHCWSGSKPPLCRGGSQHWLWNAFSQLPDKPKPEATCFQLERRNAEPSYVLHKVNLLPRFTMQLECYKYPAWCCISALATPCNIPLPSATTPNICMAASTFWMRSDPKSGSSSFSEAEPQTIQVIPQLMQTHTSA